MAYVKTNWEAAPSTNTPINPTNLNHIEQGIYDNSLGVENIGNLSNLETTNKTTIVGAINELVPVSLFYSQSGDSSDITLSESAANFKYIEIFYYINNNNAACYKSVKVPEPNGKNVTLDNLDHFSNQLVLSTKTMNINGTSISGVRNKRYTIQDSTSWQPYGGNLALYIKEVIGYK